MGIWSGIAGLGLALGPVAGGLLVDVAGWRWVFLVNVPFVLLAALLGLRWLPESRRPGAPPLDLLGAVLSTVALTGIVFALIEGVDAGWTSLVVVCAAAVGIGAAVAFFAVELRQARPLFDVRVLARPRVAAGALAILATYIAGLGTLFLLPQYVQYLQDRSALASGLELAPFGVGLGALEPVSGRLVAWYGPRVVLLAGLLIATAGYVPLLLLSGDSSSVLVVLGTGIIGCGLGLTFPPAGNHERRRARESRRRQRREQLGRQVGGALGVAIVGSVFAAIFAARIADESGVPAAAKESIEDATDVASRLHGPCRPPPRRCHELRCGSSLGPRRLHGRAAPLDGERSDRAIGCDSRQTMSERLEAPRLRRRRVWSELPVSAVFGLPKDAPGRNRTCARGLGNRCSVH